MGYVYNTTAKTIQVTAPSTARQLHNDIQTTFAGETYMQYLIPDAGAIKDALYIFQNGYSFDNALSVAFMSTGGWQSSNGNNKWTNVVAISGDNFAGIQLYYDQNSAPINFNALGLVNAIIPVRASGSDINGQSYTVYSRPFQKTYSQFSATAAAGGVDTIPLSVKNDQYLTLSQAILNGFTDLSIAWATIYRSAFDGLIATKYTLNGPLAAGATTINVNETINASVPSSGSFAIGSAINQEVITYTGKTSNSFTGCVRSAYRTTAPTTWAAGTALSTNMAQYSVQIKSTNSIRTLLQIYNWIQFQLTKSTDIDVLGGNHIGQITNILVSYTGVMSALQGVWIEGYASSDANLISFVDILGVSHTPPLTISVNVNFDAGIAGGQVSIFALNSPGLNDSTYTPSNILSTILNQPAVGTSASILLTYTADVPVRVIVRKPGYQQFSLYTTITSNGLTVASQNPIDPTY